jgi:hypothetical protein
MYSDSGAGARPREVQRVDVKLQKIGKTLAQISLNITLNKQVDSTKYYIQKYAQNTPKVLLL